MAIIRGTSTTVTMSESIRNARKRLQKPTYSNETARGASGELDELLAKILALQEPDESLGRVLQPFRHALAILDLAARDPADELGQRLRPQLHAVGDDEALHLDAVGEDRGEVLHAV